MRSDASGGRVWFEPARVAVATGTRVRWRLVEGVHTTTAYHPANQRSPRRIPAAALPWDSGYLLAPGDTFAVTFTAPGVYDFYCIPHEAAGMVGRVVVGEPGPRPWFPEPGPGDREVPRVALAALAALSP